ncbi:MAG: Polyketide cyclase / dehydrase and lipid transport [Myxococcales bacterium]|nr:Polyketide cyclase / dehydrase and lipid transport [Myxococcales bacterium]
MTSATPHRPVIEVRFGGDGLPAGAIATATVNRPVAQVWAVISDVERYPGRVPMIDKVRKEGQRITIDLRFKVSFISVGFQFSADVTVEPERWLELRWAAGEPKGIRLRFDLEPTDDGRATRVRSDAEFEVKSLGWLAKYFLKHHPEIQYGIFPGVALALLDSLKRAAEAG